MTEPTHAAISWRVARRHSEGLRDAASLFLLAELEGREPSAADVVHALLGVPSNVRLSSTVIVAALEERAVEFESEVRSAA